jgi:hypothetical protein
MYLGAVEELAQQALPAELEAFLRRVEADPDRHERLLLHMAFHPSPRQAFVDRLAAAAPLTHAVLARSQDPGPAVEVAVRRLAAAGMAHRGRDAGFRGRMQREARLRQHVNRALNRIAQPRRDRYLVEAFLVPHPRLLWQVGMQLAMNELPQRLAREVFESGAPESLYAQIGESLRQAAQQRESTDPDFRRSVERERRRREQQRPRPHQRAAPPSWREQRLPVLAGRAGPGLGQPGPRVRELIIRLGESGDDTRRQRALDLIVDTYYRRPRALRGIVYDPSFKSPPYDVETGFAGFGQPQTIKIGPGFFTDFRRRFDRRARTIGHELRHVLQRASRPPIQDPHTREFLAIYWTVTADIPGLRPLGRRQTLTYLQDPTEGAMAHYDLMPEADKRRYRREYLRLRGLVTGSRRTEREVDTEEAGRAPQRS